MSIYSPVNSEQNEIRLLRLQPGEFGHQLCCTLLSPVRLHLHYNYVVKDYGESWDGATTNEEPEGKCEDHHPSYEALSYEWGPKNPRFPILINGQELEISENLHSALLRFRFVDKDRMLWTDAICINQGDDAEKAEQVQLMSAIYQRAERVLVWLGEASGNSDLAMETLEKLGGKGKDFSPQVGPGSMDAGPHFSQFQHNWPFEDRPELSKERAPEGSEAPWMYQMFEETQRVANQLGLIKLEDLGAEEWASLERIFLERTWWKRVWIIQEIAYAREAVLHCGSRSIYWDALHNLLRQRACYHSQRLNMLLHRSYVPLDLIRSRIRNPKRALGIEPVQNSLLILLAEHRPWKSTLPVDKIFALLGLASFSNDLPIYPNYDPSDEVKVFCEATKAIIKADQNLDVLSQVHRLESDKKHENWPSWIPDWTTDGDISFLVDIPQGLRPYDAGGPWTSSYSITAPDNGGRLRGSWMKRINGLRRFALDGLVQRAPQPRLVQASSQQPALDTRKLTVNGVVYDTVEWISKLCPTNASGPNAMKQELFDWMLSWVPLDSSMKEQIFLQRSGLLQMGVMHNGPTAARRFPYLDPTFFVLTLLRGIYQIPVGTPREVVIRYIIRQFMVWMNLIHPLELGPPPFEGYPNVQWEGVLSNRLQGWKFCTTKKGWYGLVPSGAQVNDAVCVVFGSSVPLMLRKSKDGEEWEHIGSCYFYHAMAGEVILDMNNGFFESQSFVLH